MNEDKIALKRQEKKAVRLSLISSVLNQKPPLAEMFDLIALLHDGFCTLTAHCFAEHVTCVLTEILYDEPTFNTECIQTAQPGHA